MSYIMNDKGQQVIAEGAPGSLTRAKVQFPGLIRKLNAIYVSTGSREDAMRAVLRAGIRSPLEMYSIMSNSMFGILSRAAIEDDVRRFLTPSHKL